MYRGGTILIRQLQSVIREHIAANRASFLFLLMTFVLGVSAGAFTVNGLSTMQRDELSNYFQGFLQLFVNQNFKSSELLSMGLIENIKIAALLWVLGVTIIGLPFIYLVIGVRGFITGFTSGFIINALGMQGLLFSAAALLPREIIIIPCLIGIGVNGISFSKKITKGKVLQDGKKTGLKAAFLTYCLITLLFCCIILAGIIFDAYITPVLIRIITPAISL
jgi:stage II sporulation protein M